MTWLYQHPEENEKIALAISHKCEAGYYVLVWGAHKIYSVKPPIDSCGYMIYEFKNDYDLIRAYDLCNHAIPINQHGDTVDLDRLTRCKRPVKSAS